MIQSKIMGVLNVTPDSFSDGGKFVSNDAALEQAKLMIEAGVDIIDIGGESTRPGAKTISIEEEIDRTIPVIQALREHHPTVPLSIDTNKVPLMSLAIESGVSMINDISALQGTDELNTIKDSEVLICLMHMQGQPHMMQDDPKYQDIVQDIIIFFQNRIDELKKQGFEANRFYLDPGFGFGKTLKHNIALFKNLRQLKKLSEKLDCSCILIGVSRKYMIGTITFTEQSQDRIIVSVTAATLAMQANIDIIRVHDVLETFQARSILNSLSCDLANALT